MMVCEQEELYSLLIKAVYDNNLEALESILALGANPACNNNMAIRWAAHIGCNLDIINRLLLDGRVDPAADDNYAIDWAVIKGHAGIVARLLEEPRVIPNEELYEDVLKLLISGNYAKHISIWISYMLLNKHVPSKNVIPYFDHYVCVKAIKEYNSVICCTKKKSGIFNLPEEVIFNINNILLSSGHLNERDIFKATSRAVRKICP